MFKLGLLWLAKSATRELRGKTQTITGKPVHLISPYKHLLNSVLFDFVSEIKSGMVGLRVLERQLWGQGARKGRVEGAGGPGLGSGSQDGWCRGCCRVREPGRVMQSVPEGGPG